MVYIIGDQERGKERKAEMTSRDVLQRAYNLEIIRLRKMYKKDKTDIVMSILYNRSLARLMVIYYLLNNTYSKES